MWATGMFSARRVSDGVQPDTCAAAPTLSRRAGGWGWFRARLLVACAHTWDGLRRLGLWAFAGGCCLPEDPLVLVCVFFAGHGVHVGCLVDV